MFLKLIVGALLVFIAGRAESQVATTTVQGTVFRADGSPATGSLIVTWPAFTTALNQAVAAGSITATAGADGFVSLNLAPNLGAFPAGTYYTVVYHLDDGTVSKEYWTVPAASSATIAGVRAELQPATVAVQSVSKAYVDALVASISPSANTYLPLAGGALSGPLQLNSDPTASSQATTKNYVDQEVATAVPLTGGVVTGLLSVANGILKLPRVDVRDTDFAGGADPTGVKDSTGAIQAAIAYALANATPGNGNYPTVYFAPGHYMVSGTLTIPTNMHLAGDSKDTAILQETGATANLITVTGEQNCSTYICYGGIDALTLEGSGKGTAGTLLELDTGYFILRDVHFYNSAGRGLQMNGPSERIVSYDSSFYDVRWPIVMAGDTNEDYFYNTHIIEANQVKNPSGSPTQFNNWCYSINCTNGVFNGPGTTANPTLLYPEPHGSIHIDKAVNVSFIGGSIKSTGLMSGVRVWNGSVVKFEHIYHEDSYGGSIPRSNRAYIFGGKGEQTYFTGSLSGQGLSVAVKDPSWMPQYFGNAASRIVSDGNFYGYVILPQDYDRASTAPSAYVAGLLRNQYEVVNVEGFASDGNLYIQTTGRHVSPSTAPAGTQWPAGSVIEQYASGFEGTVELSNVHINQVQGPNSAGGWMYACDQTNVNACGDILAGYAPDIQNPTSNPATNQIGFYAPLGDPNDPEPSLKVSLALNNVEMFSSTNNPYTGRIATHHFAAIRLEGGVNIEQLEGANATIASATGVQMSLAGATGGSFVTAPLYSTGFIAAASVTVPNGGLVWDASRATLNKKASVFEPNEQYGSYMNGMQFENLYCLFDSPTVDGGPVTNRFCTGGGPGNNTGSGRGLGGGIEYDSWNGSVWVNLFKVNGQNGSGTLSTATAATFGSTLGVSGAATVAGAFSAQSTASIAGTLTATGAAQVGGALTASLVNNTITVDGTTYKTINAAWNAAVNAATSSAKNQTIWLGPGNYPVNATMNEPTNGACVSVTGSAGTTMGANVANTATTLTVPVNLSGDIFFLGNTTLTEGCTFRDLNILAAKNATHGFELQWMRGLLIDNVSVNDTTAEGILLGETNLASGHQAGSLLRNVTVSYSTNNFTPATRPVYGIHLQKTAIDSYMNTIVVRNAQTAAVYNEGTGNIGYGVHGFGFPYTCTTAPCSNTATSSSAANASYASSYVIYDVGGSGSVWTDTYADSPSISAFFVGANGIEIHGGHVQWPELASFPNANLANVSASVTNNMMISDVDCLGMSSTVNWINYAASGGVPPTFSSVHHLTGCGNYYQAIEPATTTAFSGGGASNNAPSSGQVATIWVSPKAPSGANYSAYSAQLYSGYTTDIFEGHVAAANPFFNITYQGTIRSTGGIMLSTVLNTATALTLTTANRNVLANAASGAQTLTLPSCFTPMADKQSPTGLELTVVKSDTSANAVTLQTVSSQTINYQGAIAATLAIGSAGKRTLVCGPDNNWYAY